MIIILEDIKLPKGNILVELFKVKDLLPMTKGNIRITNSETGAVVYEKENAFNISGESELISVDTPDKELSEIPYEQEIPYSIYNIEVTAEGYKDVIVEGVSVFEGITSIQKIQMEEETNKLGVKSFPEKIIIPEKEAVMESTEDKQMGSPIAPFVLFNVYIPEFIIVHLGSPNAGAENVTVRFVDYIKNVASSEIYPTWPEESLKANIHCQISFALNRVYTEWYRNMGYQFQITNSTAYDQYFVKDRNIFENISKIVDNIFDQYIRTIGNRTPFFAQYCNGTTVKCDGLSQWGTVDLANAGMSALEIIKYYYGYDKEIVRAEEVEGIPESYPGYPLRLNDVNENVKIIQKELNRISRNFPAIPKIYPEDGRFGKETEDAVKAFQRIFNLTPDGIVGRATWYKISSIYVGVKRLAELGQEPETGEENGGNQGAGGETESPGGDGKYPGYLLKYGSKGEKVRELQYYLNEISKIYNIPSISVDGIFGNGTKEAVIAFQRLFGLTPDGIVGPATWNKIVEVYKSIENNNSENPSNEFDEKYPGYLLKYGSKGEKVREIQYYLNQISKYYDIPSVVADGVFGNATKEAVIAFQRLFGLSQDGIIGQSTWNKIVEVYNGLKKSKTANNITFSQEYPGYVLKEGLVNDDIKWLQTYLNAISKFYNEIPEVDVDGIFKRKTKNAVMAFQKLFDLNTTGQVGVNDWNKLINVYNSLSSKDQMESKAKIAAPELEFDIQLGDKDGFVTILQRYINVLSKNNYRVNEVNVTGEFDEETKKAVESLQKEFGMDVTGKVDNATWNKIKSINEALYSGKSARNRRSSSRSKK